MNATATKSHTLVLTQHEWETLKDILEACLKETAIEVQRTEAFAAKGVVQTREAMIQSLLRKAREAGIAQS
jgi:hypothetical protein